MYIYLKYLSQPFNNWKSFENISDNIISKVAIYTHFIGGIIIMISGPFQFLGITQKLKIHKYIGILYSISCILSALGGLIYISIKGTRGGYYMSVPFGIYGILMIIYPFMTYFYIYKNNIIQHKKWAFRLFLLGNGSMLYRMLYMIACGTVLNCIHVSFNKLIDYIFDWLFFVIPIIISELYLFIF